MEESLPPSESVGRWRKTNTLYELHVDSEFIPNRTLNMRLLCNDIPGYASSIIERVREYDMHRASSRTISLRGEYNTGRSLRLKNLIRSRVFITVDLHHYPRFSRMRRKCAKSELASSIDRPGLIRRCSLMKATLSLRCADRDSSFVVILGGGNVR